MKANEVADWFKKERVGEVSVIVPDFNGGARGKSLPPEMFIDSLSSNSLRVPEAAYTVGAHGSILFNETVGSVERDLMIVPDLSTLHMEPWTKDRECGVICDTKTLSGEPYDLAPRQILKNVMALYSERGWEPIVGAEVEFYLFDKDLSDELKPPGPLTKAGQREVGQYVYSVDAFDDFEEFFDDMHESCRLQRVQLDTFMHEDGPCQYEVSLRHANALAVADQLFLFKRLSRLVAKKHGFVASFLAKPYADESGSAIHLHTSVVDKANGQNVFANKDGADSELFVNFIGGLQTHLRSVMPLFAPFTNSYNRFQAGVSAPTNFHWGRDNRTVGLRVPESSASGRRVENRIPGSDVNPYLAIAGSLICGYIGLTSKIARTAEFVGEGYESGNQDFPRTLTEALALFRAGAEIRKILGDRFVDTFADLKQEEYDHRSRVLSPWDIKYLTINV